MGVERMRVFNQSLLDAPADKVWAALGDEEKFTQAWEMVKQAHLIKGGNLDELRFQRSVVFVGRKRS